MNFADELLGQLEALLADEREAIRKLDADRVLRAADEKRALMDALAALPADERRPHKARLEQAVASIRHNGVALAHARSIVRDAVIALGGTPSLAPHERRLVRPSPSSPGGRLSLRG